MPTLGPIAGASNLSAPNPDEVARARQLRGRLPVLSRSELVLGMVAWAVFGGVFLAWMRSDPASPDSTRVLMLWLGVVVANLVLGPPPALRRRWRAAWTWVVVLAIVLVAWVLGPVVWPGWEASAWRGWFQLAFVLVVLAQLGWLASSAVRWRPVPVVDARGVLRSSPGLAVLLATDGVSRVSPQRICEVLGMDRADVDGWLLALKNGGLVQRLGVGRWYSFALTTRGRSVLDSLLGAP